MFCVLRGAGGNLIRGNAQLHLVDTAGTEQFTGIDESYIQVRIALKDERVVH